MLSSILIATTGRGRLEDVVARYLRRQGDDIEIVVVFDDPAVERSAFRAPLRSDGRLRVSFSSSSIGLTRSLNKGIEACSGELIIRNDDDDLPHPERVAKTVAFFRSHPECDVAYSFARGIDAASGRSWTIDGPDSDAAIK